MRNRIVILHEQDNPSTGYFIEPMAVRVGAEVLTYSFSERPDVDALRGATVVVVRYLSPVWRDVIEKARSSMVRFAYFMDDDLWDARTWRGLPLRYQWKLWRRALHHRDWFSGLSAQVWTPSHWLAEKYADSLPGDPMVIPLAAPVEDRWDDVEAPAESCFFYHASASHLAEARWLIPIVSGVLRQCPGAVFEVIASHALAREFARMDRVRVVPPMSWPRFRAFCRERRRAVGLAPLLDRDFNRARSPVKVIDIARAGGVGIYTSGPTFDSVVAGGLEGVTLANEPQRWIDEIAGLLGDEGRLRSMRQSSIARIRSEFGGQG